MIRIFLFISFDFFLRALLYGGMKESQSQAEVCLEDTRAEAFGMLLQYLYTGRASLSSAREDVLLDFLGLANRYGLQLLEDSTSEFLRTVLNTQNVCLVFDVATLYSLSALSAACCCYMDRHAPDVLLSDGFMTLSKVAHSRTRENDLIVFTQRHQQQYKQTRPFSGGVTWLLCKTFNSTK